MIPAGRTTGLDRTPGGRRARFDKLWGSCPGGGRGVSRAGRTGGLDRTPGVRRTRFDKLAEGPGQEGAP